LTNDIPETTQNSIEEILEEELTKSEVIIKEPLEEIYTEEEIQEEETQEEKRQENEHEEAKNIETFEEKPREALEELKPQKQDDEAEKNRKYKAIPYIDQKFKNMHVQYPPVLETSESFDSVDAWLLQISNDGYSEEDIEAMIKKIDSLSVEHKEEAAQLLLATAATESKYAKFRLARTLYKGEILQKNLPESFTLINRLATNDDYPEAICDLAQFYEYGIGIDKDKKKAELLYEEAMNLGIKRAMDHYERIRKQNSGLFSFLKK
jgi:TPR repeat protein